MFVRLIFFFLVLISWYSVTILSINNPSGTLAVSYNDGIDLFFVILLFPLFLAGIFFILLQTKRTTLFFVILFLTSISCGFVVIISALRYHRDFFTLFFQFSLLLFAAVIIQFPDFIIHNNRIKIIKVLTQIAFVMLIGCLCWIMLMGYSIATRSEPRWIESIVYNIVNVFILAFLAFSIIRLQQQTYKFLSCTQDSCTLNERDLSMHLSDREIAMLYVFMTADNNTCTCYSLYIYLSTFSLLDHTSDYSCSSCLKEQWSAVNCKFYRNIKNQLMSLKKILELVEIGTIVNKAVTSRENKNQGWQLKFFNDILISTDTKLLKKELFKI